MCGICLFGCNFVSGYMLTVLGWWWSNAEKHNNKPHPRTKQKNSSEERIGLYQTIQHTQHQINHIQTSNLFSNKRKQKLIKTYTDIDNNQSTLQTFGFKGSTTKTKHPTITQNTHMEQTALSTIILIDGDKSFGDRLQQKEKGTTRILLQNPNALDLGLDEIILHEIIDSSVKHDIDILYLSETNSNWKN